MKEHRGNRYTALLILYLGVDGVANFTPRLLYSREQPRHPLNRKSLGGPQGWSGCFGEKSLGPAGIRTPDCATCSPVNTPTELLRPTLSLSLSVSLSPSPHPVSCHFSCYICFWKLNSIRSKADCSLDYLTTLFQVIIHSLFVTINAHTYILKY